MISSRLTNLSNSFRGGKIVLMSVYALYVGISLPYFMLGSVWPAMRLDLGLPFEYIGVLNITMLISYMAACIASGWFLRRFLTGNLLLYAFLLYIAALFSLFFVMTGLLLTLLLIPLGFFMGIADSGSNFYVSSAYTAKAMTFLHLWGSLGAIIGPVIIMFCVTRASLQSTWVFTAAICLILLIPLPLTKRKGYWQDIRKPANASPSKAATRETSKKDNTVAAFTLVSFFLFASSGNMIGNLMSSYMTSLFNTGIETASLSVMVYLGALTVGRLASGVFVTRYGEKKIIRIGFVLAILGCIAGLLFRSVEGAFVAVGIIGIGTSPVYPCIIHDSRNRFTGPLKDSIVGYFVAVFQTGSVGTFVMSRVFARIGLGFLPPAIALFYFLSLVINEHAIRISSRTEKATVTSQ